MVPHNSLRSGTYHRIRFKVVPQDSIQSGTTGFNSKRYHRIQFKMVPQDSIHSGTTVAVSEDSNLGSVD